MNWSAKCGVCVQIGFANWFRLFVMPWVGFHPFSTNLEVFGLYIKFVFSPVSYFLFNLFSKNLEWVCQRDMVRVFKLTVKKVGVVFSPISYFLFQI